MKLRVTNIHFMLPIDEDYSALYARDLLEELRDDYVNTEWDVIDESEIISVVGAHSNQLIEFIETELVSD